MFSFAPFIAGLVNRGEIINFLRLFSFLFILQALTLPGSLLQKELDFLKLNLPLCLGALVGAVSAMILALNGFGPWSLACGIILGETIRVIFLWILLPYRPKISFDIDSFKEIFQFSWPLYLLTILVWLFWNGDDFLVGILRGNKQLGYYTMAFYIPHQLLIIQQLITRVSFPAFSRLQEEKEKILRGFEMLTKYSSIFILSLLSVLIPFTRQTILYLFGDKWLPASTCFIFFLILVAQRSIFGHWAQLYLALGKTKTLFFSYLPVPIILFTAGPYFTLKYGIEGMAGTVALTVIIYTPLIIYFTKKVIPVRFFKILFRPVLAFLLVFFISLKIRNFVNTFYFYLGAIIGLLLLYYLIMIILDRKLIREIKLLLGERSG